MSGKELFRFVLGYAVGIAIFFVLVPLAIFFVSRAAAPCDVILPGGPVIGAVISAALFSVGAYFAAWSNIALARIGKGGPTDGFGVAVSPRTRHLVMVGPYRYTRNPMAFGTYTCYVSFAVWLGSAAALLFLALMLFIIVPYLHRSEERRLKADFGEEYEEYKRRVSFFVPMPPKD